MAELILALDLPSAAEALTMVDRLPGLRWVKVGSILMTREGPPLIRSLEQRGLRVFLDLKWHDIPNTVAASVAAAVDLGVALATVHTLGGTRMMEAAARAGAGKTRLVGVTVLTSHDDASLGKVLGRTPVSSATEVARLARHAVAAGLDGVVCSPLEAAMLRKELGPRPLLVVPGIRQPGDAPGDQSRIATPSEAIAAGASHLVVGRPILESSNPTETLRSMMETIG